MAEIPPVGDEPYDAKVYNGLRLVPIDPPVGEMPGWGCMPEYFTTSLQKRAPLSYLRKALAARLGVEEADVSFVYEGKGLDCDLTVADNNVVEPGAMARRKGIKIEMFFQLREKVLPGSLDRERLEASKIENQRATDAEQSRIKNEEIAFRDSESKWARWREAALSGQPVSKVNMPALNFTRLMAEFRKVQQQMREDESFIEKCEPDGENLLTWHVDMVFPVDSPMQQSLQELVKATFDETLDVLTLQVRFPPDYPHSHPHIYVEKPRLKEDVTDAYGKESKNPVSFGGKMRTALLTTKGWTSNTAMLQVLEQVRQELVTVGAMVDVAVALRSSYAAPPPLLDRVASGRFPTLYDFCKEEMKLGTPGYFQPLIDKQWSETGDTIGLPAEFAGEIYGHRDFGNIKMPLLFEVTAANGTVIHCGRPDFLDGLPGTYALLPKWVIGEMRVFYGEKVRIRCIGLELITFMKIQPHHMDFYEAMKGKQEDIILAQAFQKSYSALTEDTSVGIEIDDRMHMVQINQLAPQGAVRLIDSNPDKIIEFKVEFEKAPDLEFDEDAKKRHQHILEKFQEKQNAERAAVTAEETKESRTEKLKKEHFEWLKQKTKASASASGDDGKDGEIEIRLRLPGGAQLSAKFRDGALVVAIVALVLDSDWAESCHPWGVRCTQPFPRKELDEDEVITKAMHRANINVAEVKPEDPDDILKWTNPDIVEESSPPPPVKRVKSQPLRNIMLPEYDENALQQSTLEAFYNQCQLIATKPPAAVDVPVPSSGIDKEAQVANFCSISGLEPDVGRQYLEASGWNPERAMNMLLDQ